MAVGSQPEGVVATSAGLIATAVRGDPPGLDLLVGSGPPQVRFVALGGEARHLSLAGSDGPVLVPEEPSDRLVTVVLPGGQVLSARMTGRQPHDAAAIGNTVAVADEFANNAAFLRPGQPTTYSPAPLQPGGIASGSGVFAVVGVRARVLAVYSPSGRRLGRAASGVGPTHVAAGPDGLFYVTDTLGGAVLIFRFSDRTLRQVARVPVGSRPYGIAYDGASGWLYVTLTGSNQLLGLHLAGTRVLQRRTWPTGRQPNSVAVDDHDRELAVTVTGSDQIELISQP